MPTAGDQTRRPRSSPAPVRDQEAVDALGQSARRGFVEKKDDMVVTQGMATSRLVRTTADQSKLPRATSRLDAKQRRFAVGSAGCR